MPGWPGHIAGQHVDVRLTAPDGYTAVRSYSIASAPDGDRIELTVEELDDGEVSPYLVRGLTVGDPLELRGPVGGWFVWRPAQTEAVQLVAGGSGVVPLVAMALARAAAGPEQPRCACSTPSATRTRCCTARELDGLRRLGRPGWRSRTRTRARRPTGWPGRIGRIDGAAIAAATLPPADAPTCYVCGPTSFVETAADLLVRAGHDPARIRTERFGGTGGGRL